MRHYSNTIKNIANAYKSNDLELARHFVYTELARMIDEEPNKVADLLNESGVTGVSSQSDKTKLVEASSREIIRNKKFQDLILAKIAINSKKSNFYKANGEGVSDLVEQVGQAGQSAGGGQAGAIIGSLSELGSNIFGFFTTKKQMDIEEQQAKSSMYANLLKDDDDGTNWLPIAIIGGVLLIGGVVVWKVLGSKNK